MLGIFVPAWGWVGSAKTYPYQTHNSNFRPRLGMGWFIANMLYINIKDNFRPRVGMGWFYKEYVYYQMIGNFRPRVGMGWFDFAIAIEEAIG